MTTLTQGTVCNLNVKTSYGEPVYKILSFQIKHFYRTTAMLSAVYAVIVCLSACLSVCLSVCVSVCNTPVLYQNG